MKGARELLKNKKDSFGKWKSCPNEEYKQGAQSLGKEITDGNKECKKK